MSTSRSSRYSKLENCHKHISRILTSTFSPSQLAQFDLDDLAAVADILNLADHVQFTGTDEKIISAFQQNLLDPEVDLKTVKTISTTNYSSIKVVSPHGAPTSYGKRIKYILKTCRKPIAYKLRHQNSLWNERNLLTSLSSSSPYIPTLHAALQSPTSLYFVMQYVAGGDLEAVLNDAASHGKGKDESIGVSEPWTKFWIGEVVEVLGWLHNKGWVHRDVKPSNILLSHSSHIVLTDFGSSSPLLSSSKVPQDNAVVPIGTCDYIAPEILQWHEVVVSGEEDDEEEAGYGMEVDWWSLGVMTYELLTTQMPFFDETISETYRMITAHGNSDITFPPTSRISQISRSFVNGLLKDSSRRLNYSRIIAHPFLSNIPWGKTHPIPSGTPLSVPRASEPSFSVSPSFMFSSKKSFGFSQHIDFTSFLSSPGMSVLRESDDNDTSTHHLTRGSMKDKKQSELVKDFWAGFSWFGKGFDWMEATPKLQQDDDDQDYSDDIDENLKQFITPAKPARGGRRGASESQSSRKVRGISEMEAWKEMTEIAWEIGMSVKKQKVERGGRTPAKTPSRMREYNRGTQTSEEEDPTDTTIMYKKKQEDEETDMDAELNQFQRRHDMLLSDIDDIEKQYKDLFDMADRYH